jgi:hypothetical protein
MDAILYLLCTGTALVCSVLLLRGFLRTRVRLLLWSGLCFAFLTVENLLLILDRIVFPAVDLAPWLVLFAFMGIALLLYGLIRKD